jgi:hypothetical protein
MSQRPVRVLSSILALLLLCVVPASAHETGAIHVSANQVAAGGSLTVRGEKLPKSSDLKLELRGILDNYPVGTVKTDTAGAFRLSLTVPPNVPAGAYTLVVIASDGDVTARADLAVSAAVAGGPAATGPTSSTGKAGMPGMPDHDMAGMSDERATAEPMAIAHTTTVAGWIVIWGVVITSLVAGGMLVSQDRGHQRPG